MTSCDGSNCGACACACNSTLERKNRELKSENAHLKARLMELEKNIQTELEKREIKLRQEIRKKEKEKITDEVKEEIREEIKGQMMKQFFGI